jgi:hypothetical protein
VFKFSQIKILIILWKKIPNAFNSKSIKKNDELLFFFYNYDKSEKEKPKTMYSRKGSA